MRFKAIWVIFSVLWISGCGVVTKPVVTGPLPIAYRTHREEIPVLRWFSVPVGSEVQLNEGTSVSSVVEGPQHRIYYGTENPLADANAIGFINPHTGNRVWSTVPTVSPPFPTGAEPTNLSQNQAAYWGDVKLVVSGQHTVWYRHWGYVGGWTKSKKFVPGAYGISGPTVSEGNWTASAHATFSGNATLRVMNVPNKTMISYPLPSTEAPMAVAFSAHQHSVWVLTSSALWQLSRASGQWQSVATPGAADFFVAMGQASWGVWVVDANGNVDTVNPETGLQHLATLDVSPLTAVSAGGYGLWIASPNHLTLWRLHGSTQQWKWPRPVYPAPASSWPTTGQNAPPDWPPLPHLAPAPAGAVDIGYGTWVGQATFHTVDVRSKVIPPKKEATQ